VRGLATIGQAVILVSILIGGFVLTLPAHAAKTIYKCTRDGQVTLTDKPCEGSPSPESSNTTSPQSSATNIASSSNPSPEVRIVIGVGGQVQRFDLKFQVFLDEAYESD
jgi:Domain of unknown function (DUF4124)